MFRNLVKRRGLKYCWSEIQEQHCDHFENVVSISLPGAFDDSPEITKRGMLAVDTIVNAQGLKYCWSVGYVKGKPCWQSMLEVISDTILFQFSHNIYFE